MVPHTTRPSHNQDPHWFHYLKNTVSIFCLLNLGTPATRRQEKQCAPSSPLSSEMTCTSSYSSAGSVSRLCFSIALWITAGVLSWLVSWKDNDVCAKCLASCLLSLLKELSCPPYSFQEKWPSGVRAGPRARTRGF